MYEDKWEFPEGWGGGLVPSVGGGGGYGYFLEPHNLKSQKFGMGFLGVRFWSSDFFLGGGGGGGGGGSWKSKGFWGVLK